MKTIKPAIVIVYSSS